MQQSTTTTTTTPYLPTYEEALSALQQADRDSELERLIDTYIVRQHFDDSHDRLSPYLRLTAVVQPRLPPDQRLIRRRAKLQRNTVHWLATDDDHSREVKRKLEVVREEDRRLDDPSLKDIDTERDSVRLVSSTSVGPPSRTCCAATMSATSSSNNKDRPKVILVRTSSTPKQQGWKKEEDMTQEELVADKLWCEPGPQLVRLLDVAMRPENEPKDKQTTVDIVVVSDDEVEEEPEDCNGCIQTTMTRKRISKLRRIPTRRPTTRCCTRQRQLLLRRRRRWKRKTSTMYLLLLPRLASDSSVPT